MESQVTMVVITLGVAFEGLQHHPVCCSQQGEARAWRQGGGVGWWSRCGKVRVGPMPGTAQQGKQEQEETGNEAIETALGRAGTGLRQTHTQ